MADIQRATTVAVKRNSAGRFGFSVNGGLDDDSLPFIQRAGDSEVVTLNNVALEQDSLLVGVDGFCVLAVFHDELVKRLKACGDTVSLTVVNAAAASVFQTVSGLLQAKGTDDLTLSLQEQCRTNLYRVATPVTTRPRRHHEVAGEPYLFVAAPDFVTLIHDNELYEYGKCDGHFYGTLKIHIDPKVEGREQPRHKPVSASVTFTNAVRHGHAEATVGEVLALHGHTAGILASQPLSRIMPVSDAAKTAQIKAALYEITVPVTTRKPKDGEVEGKDFHFISFLEFHNLIETNQLLEWGEHNGELYGTCKVTKEDIFNANSTHSRTAINVSKVSDISVDAHSDAALGPHAFVWNNANTAAVCVACGAAPGGSVACPQYNARAPKKFTVKLVKQAGVGLGLNLVGGAPEFLAEDRQNAPVLDITLTRTDGQKFGINIVSVQNNAHRVAFTVPGSVSDGRLFQHDEIVTINGAVAHRMTHDELYAAMVASPSTLNLTVRRVSSNNASQPLFVHSLRLGSIAAKDGRLKSGDQVVALADLPTDGLSLSDIRTLIAEEAGSITVTVVRDPELAAAMALETLSLSN